MENKKEKAGRQAEERVGVNTLKCRQRANKPKGQRTKIQRDGNCNQTPLEIQLESFSRFSEVFPLVVSATAAPQASYSEFFNMRLREIEEKA